MPDLIGNLRNRGASLTPSTIAKAWSEEARASAALARQAGVKQPPARSIALRHQIAQRALEDKVTAAIKAGESDLNIGIKVAEAAVAQARAKKLRDADKRREGKLQAKLRLTGYPK